MLTNTLKRQIEVFTQILLAIMFTTNSYVKYRMLHVMRYADDISGVKTGELHPGGFLKNNPQYLVILYGDLS